MEGDLLGVHVREQLIPGDLMASLYVSSPHMFSTQEPADSGVILCGPRPTLNYAACVLTIYGTSAALWYRCLHLQRAVNPGPVP